MAVGLTASGKKMTESRIAGIGDLALKGGGILRDAEVAYVTYGRLADDGSNAVLLTHGYTSSHLFADGDGASEGSWSGLVGPGRAIDTDRLFVVSSNMLGSSHGTTGPKSRNPGTGKPYGPDFPAIALEDIVAAQHRLLGKLGVNRLLAVVGPSYGGFQAFAWAIQFPEFMRGIVAAVSGPRSPRSLDVDKLEARFAQHPNWNGGHYYEAGGILDALTAQRVETLRGYGINEQLAEAYPDPAARDRAVEAIARDWAESFDAHSLMVLGRAANAYDASQHLHRIKARVLYVLSRTDKLFPPSLANEVMPALRAAGVAARYVEIDSENGHLASGADSALWAEALRGFLDGLSASGA
jgi:homoserine O-acetyltransferase